MYTHLNHLPPTAKAWLFPCRTRLSDTQQQAIHTQMRPFLDTWTAHEEPLEASLYVDAYQIALFVDADKVSPSGCALDKWHSTLERCAKQLNIDCFYYHQVLCQQAGELHLYTHEEALRAWQAGQLSNDTPIADVGVKTKAAFFSPARFLPLGESWLARQRESIAAL